MNLRTWLVVAVVHVYSVRCFLFSSASRKTDSCSRLVFTCPPMCFVRSNAGCTCKCTNQANPMANPNFDPSNPGGSMVQPSINPANPLGHYIPGLQPCSSDWMNCHSPCAPAIDYKTGCPHCQCPQSPTSSIVTTGSGGASAPILTNPAKPIVSTIAPTTQKINPTTKSGNTMAPNVPTTQPNTPTLSTTTGNAVVTPAVMNPSTTLGNPRTTPAMSSTTSTYPTSLQTSSTPIAGPVTTPKISIPVVQTTPHPPTQAPPTTVAPSTTMATVVCPGVFNCVADCFAGYKSDANGCPLCECEPLPTGFP
ncbi:uncharacterized protein [Argopecten irradians]|uniref:uncharacterized protein n=1 Tax=Argopecten irradians TaxID=31199 RepID=UPI0037234173